MYPMPGGWRTGTLTSGSHSWGAVPAAQGLRLPPPWGPHHAPDHHQRLSFPNMDLVGHVTHHGPSLTAAALCSGGGRGPRREVWSGRSISEQVWERSLEWAQALLSPRELGRTAQRQGSCPCEPECGRGACSGALSLLLTAR